MKSTSSRFLTKPSDSVRNDLKPHLSNYWEIPPEQDADFVYHMEDILSLYHEPYDEKRPVICFDESSKALRGHEREPLPTGPERSHVSITATAATENSDSMSPLNH